MRRAMHLFGTALRETGQAVDRLGLTMAENEIYKETFARHRSVMNLYDKVRRVIPKLRLVGVCCLLF
jgi:gamma-carbonic anhydrase